jgi:hypothetical protein
VDRINGAPNVRPRFGYKFTGWRMDKQYQNKNYIEAEAQFELRISWWKICTILAGVLLVIALFFIILFLRNGGKNEDPSNQDIKNYVEDIKLQLNKLEEYEKKVKNSPRENKSIMNLFSNNNETENSIDNVLLAKVDTAISIRNAIIAGDIKKLQKYKYSKKQKKFETSIDLIADTLCDEVKDIMKAFPDKIDTLDLNVISKRIDTICDVIKLRDKMKNEGKKETLEKEKNTLEQRLKNPEDSIIIDKVGVIGIIEKRLLPLTGRKPSGAVASSDSGASNGTGTSGEDDDLIKEVESYIQGVDFMHEDLEKLMDRCNSAKIKKEHKTYKRLEYCIAFRTLINTFSDKMPEFNKLYQQIPKLKTDGKYKWYNFLYQITLSEDNFNSYLKIQHKYKKSLKEIEDEYNSLNKTK